MPCLRSVSACEVALEDGSRVARTTLTRLDNDKRVHSMTGAELNCVLVRVHVTWLERRRVREGESESERELCKLGVATSIAVISEILTCKASRCSVLVCV